MKVLRFLIIALFTLIMLAQNALCADNFRVSKLILDNSDRMVLIKGVGNYRTNLQTIQVPVPNSDAINFINNVNPFTITAPARYVVDIPNAVLDGGSRVYKVYNSKVIQSIQLAQFSSSPDVVRIVFTLYNNADLTKFKTYTSGENLIVKYAPNIIDNSIQYKFYTPFGDKGKNASIQETSAIVSYNHSDRKIEKIPSFRTKYYLSQVSQNSDGLILRGIGSISLQRAHYSQDNTQAYFDLDNASTIAKIDSKTYKIPSSDDNINATLTLNVVSPKKIRITIDAENARDYRFVISPDGQSLFVSHRNFIINTVFSNNPAVAKAYNKISNSNGYKILDFEFDKSVTYDVFELNDKFYLDVNNLGDYNIPLFENTFKESDVNIEAIKISNDKTRFIIDIKDLNLAYANVESNAKSIKLCFKEKPKVIVTPEENNTIIIASGDKDRKSENINVIYIPKDDTLKYEKPKKHKERISLRGVKKVVIDPGHGGLDSGAIAGGIQEKDLNLQVAKLVNKKLARKNIKVYMTRQYDSTQTLEDRVKYSNEINPDLFVSIHTNSTVKEDSYGIETHYYKDDSINLANIIHSNFATDRNIRRWDTKDRGVLKSRFYVINHTEAPSVLIEIGFISNFSERIKLIKEDRQEEIASSIVNGILEYLKQR